VGKEIRIIVIAARKKPVNYTQQVRDIKSILLKNCPKESPPNAFIGVESQPPWIPDRSIRE
jgi:hypothetical protein